MVLPLFLGPQTKTDGGFEEFELLVMASAALDHSSGTNISGDEFSVSAILAVTMISISSLSPLLLYINTYTWHHIYMYIPWQWRGGSHAVGVCSRVLYFFEF